MNFIEVKEYFASNSQEDAAVITAIPAQFLAHAQTFDRGVGLVRVEGWQSERGEFVPGSARLKNPRLPNGTGFRRWNPQ